MVDRKAGPATSRIVPGVTSSSIGQAHQHRQAFDLGLHPGFALYPLVAGDIVH